MEIVIEGMSKRYKTGTTALKDVSLTIGTGMFGLLGPNGAGKTTLMRILATLMKPSEGRALVNGLDLQRNRRDIRAMLGYLPQDFRFFSKLTTWEFLDYAARLAGLHKARQRQSAVEAMLEQVGLFEVRDRKANKLSGGMKRRLGIAQALIGSPKIVIVDEPTTGLDPEERIRFRNVLSDMSQKEIIIILSTHIVGDISSACHHMALLNRGDLAFHGPPDQLVELARGHVWEIEALDSELDSIKETYPVIATIPSETGWSVQVVADKLDSYPGKLLEPNLEHAYVYYMEYRLQGDWETEEW